ncbi:glycosyltransferase [Feifania hominis]|uniref:Glycosyltransferase n=1 Tax=Feifania hominis TaxID=2763660 RepID=A0A926HTC6_9FIRM|nr:glycosyltransferase [Feifania hominis]MBC8535173.1 glycosyltransferase [Feifania hominis]
MIRVTQILSDSNIGGAGTWVLKFAGHYDPALIELSVLVPRGAAITPLLRQTGAEVVEVPMAPDRSYDRQIVTALREPLRRLAPDVVHTHGSFAGRVAARRYTDAAAIYTKHTLDGERSGVKRAVWRFLDRRYSDGIIAVSECAKRNLIANGADPGRITVIYNGTVPIEPVSPGRREELRRGFGLEPDAFVFAIVARLEPIKDHRTFLRAAALAAAEHPNARFLIVGGGSLRGALESFARELGIGGQTVFTGEIAGAADVYRAADAVVLSSESENMPLSVLEAMSAGLPVLSTDVGGVREAVSDGISGLLAARSDAAALARGMARLMDEPELARTLGAAGERIYREKFTIERCVDRTQQLYQEARRV